MNAQPGLEGTPAHVPADVPDAAAGHDTWVDRHVDELDQAMHVLRGDAATIRGWGFELADRLSAGARLLAAGNGGSAAEAQHLTSELVGRFVDERRPLSAIALSAETSSLTAIVNDYGIDEMFARQVHAHGRPGDVVLLLSTSGRSPNVLRAAERANALGLTTWALTGPGPNPLADRCDAALTAAAPSTAAIQAVHLVLVHALCAAVDERLAAGAGTIGTAGKTGATPRDTAEAAARDATEAAPRGEALPDRGEKFPASGNSPARSLPPTPADRRPHVVVVGDVLLDRDVQGKVERICQDAPAPVLDVTDVRESPGGAGLTALLAVSSGARVTLVAPIADDPSGDHLVRMLEPQMDVVRLGHLGATRRKIRVRSGGQSLVRMDDGGPGTPQDVDAEHVRSVLAGADVVLVSDYAGGVTADPAMRELIAEAARRGLVVWDPHIRGAAPVPRVALVTPNLSEARIGIEAVRSAAVASGEEARAGAVHADEMAAVLREAWQARAVCVTAGATGAFVALSGSEPLFIPAVPVQGGDPCGAGDRFVSSAAVALATGAVLSEAVDAAVRDASAWVGLGGAEAFRTDERRGGGPGPDSAAERALADAADAVSGASGDGTALAGTEVLDAEPAALQRLAARLRTRGGTLVATGGCFDIVHAGHVATLQAARKLGDALVVLVNSDDSVRRLKGPERPVVTASDRARVLQAFDAVDAVVVFDQDDPREALRALRPDVWAKGGDYGGTTLPEADDVHAYGGRIVLLPYLSGRSTTTMIERSRHSAASGSPNEPAMTEHP